MASSFTSEGPVLNFGPRAPVQRPKREYLLWPAWAYRVVAPRIRERHLNMLQRAVLGLCRAGRFSIEDMAQKLGLHKELVGFILTELTNLGFVNPDGDPTVEGLQVLDDDLIETQDMVAGYVFQDPWNSQLWPRFAERLDYCDLEYQPNGFPKLLFGTTGKPWRQGAFMALPNGLPGAVLPSPTSVVAAVAAHRKHMRYGDNFEGWDEEFGDGGYPTSGPHIDRVSFVSEEPEPVYLMTYLYMEDSSHESTDWYVCDPFGLGPSMRLRRRIENVMQKMPPLHDLVSRLVGRGIYDNLEEQRQWLEHLRMSAELEVEHRLTVNARTIDAFDQIVDMAVRHRECVSLGHSCPSSKISDGLRACSKTLEALFGGMARQHPLGDVWKKVYVKRVDARSGKERWVQQQDRAFNSEKYRRAALAVGFEEPLPSSLLNVKPGQIRSVAEYGDSWRLRPLVTATVLAAERDPEHPVHEAARRAPSLLALVDNIATKGGAAGHAGSGGATLVELEDAIERTYEVISAVSGLGLESRPSAADIQTGGPHGEA